MGVGVVRVGALYEEKDLPMPEKEEDDDDDVLLEDFISFIYKLKITTFNNIIQLHYAAVESDSKRLLESVPLALIKGIPLSE